MLPAFVFSLCSLHFGLGLLCSSLFGSGLAVLRSPSGRVSLFWKSIYACRVWVGFPQVHFGSGPTLWTRKTSSVHCCSITAEQLDPLKTKCTQAGSPHLVPNKAWLNEVDYKINLIQNLGVLGGLSPCSSKRDKPTISDGAGLGFVKADHLGSFGTDLNLFVELQKQENYI